MREAVHKVFQDRGMADLVHIVGQPVDDLGLRVCSGDDLVYAAPTARPPRGVGRADVSDAGPPRRPRTAPAKSTRPLPMAKTRA